MNRRSFLKFCGIAPVVPGLAVEVLSHKPVIEQIYFLTLDDNNKATPFKKSWTPGSTTMYIKNLKTGNEWIQV